MEFRDFCKLVAKVTEYEELLKEESYQRKKDMGAYYQEMNQEVAWQIYPLQGHSLIIFSKKRHLICGRRHKLLVHMFSILLR